MKKRSKELLVEGMLGLAAGAMFAVTLGCVIVTKDESRLLRRQVGQAMLEVSNLQTAQEDEMYRLEQVEAEQKCMRANVEANNQKYVTEIEILARCVEAEAGNQSIDVKRAVISVILNRVDDDAWPDSISEVIADPYEFATYWNGAMDEVEPSVSTYEAISMEMEIRSYPGLFYFDMDAYLPYGTPYARMGDLYFSTK